MNLFQDYILLRGIRNVFFISVLVIIAGSVVDFIILPQGNRLLVIDSVSILIYIISLGIYFIKKSTISVGFSVVAYTFLANTMCHSFLNDDIIRIVPELYRRTIFVGFIATVAAYIVNKYQPVIMAVIYSVFCIVFYKFTLNVLQVNYLFVLIGAFVAYSLILYYFVRVQEQTLSELHKNNSRIKDLNRELTHKSEEIASQRDALERQKNLIEDRNTEIISAIRFARSIQQSVLPSHLMLSDYFSDYFVYNKPKAVISGDFFWMIQHNQKVFVAAVDCTGHGVPGALVSMVVNTILGRAFKSIQEPDTIKVLNYINLALIKEFKTNDGFQLQIGMDIALLSFDFSNKTLEFSGAFSPIIRIRDTELSQFAASRFIMGLPPDQNKASLTSQVLDLQKGDRFYLFSDGIVDQFGGPDCRKFGYPRFRETLLSFNRYTMSEQRERIQALIKAWKGTNQQTDDILVVGIEV